MRKVLTRKVLPRKVILLENSIQSYVHIDQCLQRAVGATLSLHFKCLGFLGLFSKPYLNV